MRVSFPKSLKGGANYLLDQPLLADFAKATAKVSNGKRIQIRCHLSEKLNELRTPLPKIKRLGGLKLKV